MKCPICLNELICEFDEIFRRRRCACQDPSHCHIHLDYSGECIKYWMKIKNIRLMGSRNKNLTEILKWDNYKTIVSTNWIPIKTDNLPTDIPKLINRLLKLKTFE